LHRDRQIARRWLSDRQVGALRQGQIAGRLHGGLAAAVDGHLEQQFKGLIGLLERQHLGLGALSAADQAFNRGQQLEQFADLRAHRRRRGGRQREDVDFACHTRTQPEEIALLRVRHGMYNAARRALR